MLSVLSLMATSPQPHYSSSMNRFIASVSSEGATFPKYKAAVKNLDELPSSNINFNVDDYCNELAELRNKIKTEEELAKKDATQLDRSKIEKLAQDLHHMEIDLDNRLTLEVVDPNVKNEEEFLSQEIKESKSSIENLLNQIVDGPKPVVADNSVVEKVEDETTQTSTNVSKNNECEEKTILLSQQIHELANQQNEILKIMLNMTQVMLSMQQRQMENPYFSNSIYSRGLGLVPTPYLYHAPVAAGNWVYYPQGFQPQQDTIFNSNQNAPSENQTGTTTSQAPLENKNYGWNLRPTPFFEGPVYQDVNYTTGQFGVDQFSFNFSNQPYSLYQG